MARRRTVVQESTPAGVLSWHPALEAGACVEVWAADYAVDDPGRSMAAFRRWRSARRAWITASRVEAADLPRWASRRSTPRRSRPWSARFLKAEGRLDEWLTALGLETSWEPVGAPHVLLALAPYGRPPEAALRALLAH